jgi:hypothetical protein
MTAVTLTREERDRARQLARDAFPVLTSCEHCQTAERLERHHPDLSKPLAITVLCKKCHVAEHQRGFGSITVPPRRAGRWWRGTR